MTIKIKFKTPSGENTFNVDGDKVVWGKDSFTVDDSDNEYDLTMFFDKSCPNPRGCVRVKIRPVESFQHNPIFEVKRNRIAIHADKSCVETQDFHIDFFYQNKADLQILDYLKEIRLTNFYALVGGDGERITPQFVL